MTQGLTHEAFTGCLEAPFQTTHESGKAIDLALKEISDVKTIGSHQTYSVLFKGPKSDFLIQKIYTLTHDKVGSHDIFLVPVGEDNSGYEYEAVFSFKEDQSS